MVVPVVVGTLPPLILGTVSLSPLLSLLLSTSVPISVSVSASASVFASAMVLIGGGGGGGGCDKVDRISSPPLPSSCNEKGLVAAISRKKLAISSWSQYSEVVTPAALAARWMPKPATSQLSDAVTVAAALLLLLFPSSNEDVVVGGRTAGDKTCNMASDRQLKSASPVFWGLPRFPFRFAPFVPRVFGLVSSRVLLLLRSTSLLFFSPLCSFSLVPRKLGNGTGGK